MTISLDASSTPPKGVFSPSKISLFIGNPPKELLTFTGVAEPEWDAKGNLDSETVIVTLPGTTTPFFQSASSVGLASITNTDSDFTFAADETAVIIGPTGQLELHINIAVQGDDSLLSRINYHVEVLSDPIVAKISGTIRWNEQWGTTNLRRPGSKRLHVSRCCRTHRQRRRRRRRFWFQPLGGPRCHANYRRSCSRKWLLDRSVCARERPPCSAAHGDPEPQPSLLFRKHRNTGLLSGSSHRHTYSGDAHRYRCRFRDEFPGWRAMSDYTQFDETADGSLFPDVIRDLRWVSVPARSPNSAGNLWVRVTGLARFDIDPVWSDDELGWHRGELGIVIPTSALNSGDVNTASAATGSFRVMKRDEGDALDSVDDFGIAIDGIANIGVSPSGFLNIALQVGYKGDCWLLAVSFSLDLLVYRPSLDNVAPPSTPHSNVVRLALDVVNQAIEQAFVGSH
jgi:hypothetical protein